MADSDNEDEPQLSAATLAALRAHFASSGERQAEESSEHEDEDEDEDEWQEVQLGRHAIRLRVAHADSDIPGSLFATHLWTGARLLAQRIARGLAPLMRPPPGCGGWVVELGAAAGLPSLAAQRQRAGGVAVVVSTDLPLPRLLQRLALNGVQNVADSCGTVAAAAAAATTATTTRISPAGSIPLLPPSLATVQLLRQLAASALSLEGGAPAAKGAEDAAASAEEATRRPAPSPSTAAATVIARGYSSSSCTAAVPTTSSAPFFIVPGSTCQSCQALAADSSCTCCVAQVVVAHRWGVPPVYLLMLLAAAAAEGDRPTSLPALPGFDLAVASECLWKHDTALLLLLSLLMLLRFPSGQDILHAGAEGAAGGAALFSFTHHVSGCQQEDALLPRVASMGGPFLPLLRARLQQQQEEEESTGIQQWLSTLENGNAPLHTIHDAVQRGREVRQQAFAWLEEQEALERSGARRPLRWRFVEEERSEEEHQHMFSKERRVQLFVFALRLRVYRDNA